MATLNLGLVVGLVAAFAVSSDAYAQDEVSSTTHSSRWSTLISKPYAKGYEQSRMGVRLGRAMRFREALVKKTSGDVVGNGLCSEANVERSSGDVVGNGECAENATTAREREIIDKFRNSLKKKPN